MSKEVVDKNKLNLRSRTMKKLNVLYKRSKLRKDDDSFLGIDISVKNKTSTLLRTSDSVMPTRECDSLYRGYDY